MQSSHRSLRISIPGQTLELVEDGQVKRIFPVSTAAAGVGSEPGSLRTPSGRFLICEKIGHGAPPGMIFTSREPTGELGDESAPDDFVQTRILWLDGLEPGNANTRSRYIYIHGTNHESSIGTPESHGCIRMRNHDIVELFDAVDTGTEVVIQP